ncbi:hypothetical protein HYFRA_00011134 [Hymenoscyphus fraxineus]|uniref:Uncharacterized protein n=1 Tax=Hymenoscyphus fraxineus TaxID=746836 RepID=A0A9N9L6J6_9HELO|nr:hypothetical protein HYFRA_00011134 [Hymenoscyphus fraxineus]
MSPKNNRKSKPALSASVAGSDDESVVNTTIQSQSSVVRTKQHDKNSNTSIESMSNIVQTNASRSFSLFQWNGQTFTTGAQIIALCKETADESERQNIIESALDAWTKGETERGEESYAFYEYIKAQGHDVFDRITNTHSLFKASCIEYERHRDRQQQALKRFQTAWKNDARGVAIMGIIFRPDSKFSGQGTMVKLGKLAELLTPIEFTRSINKVCLDRIEKKRKEPSSNGPANKEWHVRDVTKTHELVMKNGHKSLAVLDSELLRRNRCRLSYLGMVEASSTGWLDPRVFPGEEDATFVTAKTENQSSTIQLQIENGEDKAEKLQQTKTTRDSDSTQLSSKAPEVVAEQVHDQEDVEMIVGADRLSDIRLRDAKRYELQKTLESWKLNSENFENGLPMDDKWMTSDDYQKAVDDGSKGADKEVTLVSKEIFLRKIRAAEVELQDFKKLEKVLSDTCSFLVWNNEKYKEANPGIIGNTLHEVNATDENQLWMALEDIAKAKVNITNLEESSYFRNFQLRGIVVDWQEHNPEKLENIWPAMILPKQCGCKEFPTGLRLIVEADFWCPIRMKESDFYELLPIVLRDDVDLCDMHIRALQQSLGLHVRPHKDLVYRRLQCMLDNRHDPELKQKYASWFNLPTSKKEKADVDHRLRSLGGNSYIPLLEVQRIKKTSKAQSLKLNTTQRKTFTDRGVLQSPAVVWLAEHEELIFSEARMMRHHYRDQEQLYKTKELKNMYFSVVQQALRGDPRLWLEAYALRADDNYQLFPFPTPAIHATKTDDILGFLTIDANHVDTCPDGFPPLEARVNHLTI